MDRVFLFKLQKPNKMNQKIIKARITAMPRPMTLEGMFDPMPQVYVTTDDNVEQFLFEYYPDEISFTDSEFVGLTIDQARDLKRKKDVNYLKS